MFSTSNKSILFSKVYSTLYFYKDSLRPINGYGQDAVTNLITSWYKLSQLPLVSNEPVRPLLMGYYSIYSGYLELYNSLIYIEESINLDKIKSDGYVLEEKEINQYNVLLELIKLLPAGNTRGLINSDNSQTSK